MNDLVLSNHSLMPLKEEFDKDQRHRVNAYNDWLIETHRHWMKPDLTAYIRHMQKRGLSDTTVKTHVATVKSLYRQYMRSNEVRSALYAVAKGNPANKKAQVDEIIIRIKNAIDEAQIETITRQDESDRQQLRLTRHQAEQLLRSPDLSKLSGLRDASLIALMLCTGIREFEAVNVKLEHLRQTSNSALGLLVIEGKGKKQRFVPYGELAWCLILIERWMSKAGITSGYVFRGVNKGEKSVRKTGLSLSSVDLILARYPISIDGQLYSVNAHDLRRTYARSLYDAGVDINAIRLNLGHADTKTTWRYIGDAEMGKRKAPMLYSIDLTKLGMML